MKATRIIIALLVFALAMAGAAFANCSPAKTFTGYNTIENPGAYYYIPFGDLTITPADFVGRFWQTGNRGASNEGSYDDAAWLIEPIGSEGLDLWYLNGNLGDSGVAGCPVDSLTVTIEDQKNGQFVSMTVAEDPPRSQTYDYSKLGVDTPMVSIPRPQVTSSSRAGDAVTLNLSFASASAGVYDNDGTGNGITSVVVYQASTTGDPDPGASFDHAIGGSAGWAQVGATTDGGSITGLAVDCSGADQMLAVGLEIDGVAPMSVGPRSLVECDGTLADPSGKFKLIDRPTKGNGKPLKSR